MIFKHTDWNSSMKFKLWAEDNWAVSLVSIVVGAVVRYFLNRWLNRPSQLRTEIEALKHTIKEQKAEIELWKGSLYHLTEAILRDDKNTISRIFNESREETDNGTQSVSQG